jgi:FkbM family methyltransferase
MALLKSVRALVRPRYRVNWIRGRCTTEGLVWYLRGTNFPPTHEDWLRSLIHPFEGELFVDVGAHIGTWAIRATRTFRQVVAFEPNVETNRILRTTVKMNGLSNISVFSAALSNTRGERVMSTKSRMSRRRLEHRVPVRTLDSFKLKPSLLKIDTEGDEFPVLQGAEETLKRRPNVLVETHSPRSLCDTRDCLEAHGYSIREFRRENRFNQTQSWLFCN